MELKNFFAIVHDGSNVKAACKTKAEFARFVAECDGVLRVTRALSGSEYEGLAAIVWTTQSGEPTRGAWRYDSELSDDEIITQWFEDLDDYYSILGDGLLVDDPINLAHYYNVKLEEEFDESASLK